MSNLQYLQQQFWGQLRSRSASEENILQISNIGNLNAKNRLDIYQQTTRTAHTSALAECYECCETILGSKYFNQLAKEYYYQYPSEDQDLNQYGQYFIDFLATYISEHEELSDYHYLIDLAKLEKHYQFAFFSKDEAKFDFEAISSLDESSYQNICFLPNSSLEILKSNFPIYEIWSENKDSNSEQKINAIKSPQYLCIYRTDIVPAVEKINFQEWWTLEKILMGFSFSEIESHAIQHDYDISLNVIIPHLIQKGLLCGFTIKHVDGG